MLHRFTVTGKGWPEILIARIAPQRGQDSWGEFSSLKGTPWGNFPIVSGETLSHALHGHMQPLMNVLGKDPAARLRAIPEELRACSAKTACSLYDPNVCHPSKDMPECYSPVGVEYIATEIALAWREGYYVIVVVGEEFLL